MFDDMLSDIIAILIGNEVCTTSVEFLEDRIACIVFAMFEHPLDDSTSVGMSCKCCDLAGERIDDELDMLSRYSFDGFLDDVIAILVFDASENTVLKLLDKAGLLIGENMFESLQGGQITLWTLEELVCLTFCTTRQPYICSDRLRTCPFILLARTFF